jgi:hypothetical protein
MPNTCITAVLLVNGQPPCFCFTAAVAAAAAAAAAGTNVIAVSVPNTPGEWRLSAAATPDNHAVTIHTVLHSLLSRTYNAMYTPTLRQPK